MKAYAISTGNGIHPNNIYKTMELAKKHLLEKEPTAKREAKRSTYSGCEVYYNIKEKAYYIITLNIITK